jgi:hypothetical protein
MLTFLCDYVLDNLSKIALHVVAKNTLCKMNKLSLVGMQQPEKYKENFDVSSEGPSSGVTVHILLALPTLVQTVLM